MPMIIQNSLQMTCHMVSSYITCESIHFLIILYFTGHMMDIQPPAVIEVPKEPIIIVGAGMSGLVAAYELTKAGYNVQILEMSQRFGGRVKTLDIKDGFDRGLHTDGELYSPRLSYIHCCI